MSEKAEYARLAQIFREAGQAAVPWMRTLYQSSDGQSALSSMSYSGEQMAQYQAVGAVLNAIADAYHRAADEAP